MAKIKFCELHQIGYNPQFDRNCPQCVLARVSPMPRQLDYDVDNQRPIDPDKTLPASSDAVSA